jgi:hypothetical protein
MYIYLSCFVCTSVRTTATEWKLNCNNNNNNNNRRLTNLGLIPFIGFLLSGFTILCGTVDDQLFLQPHLLPCRKCSQCLTASTTSLTFQTKQSWPNCFFGLMSYYKDKAVNDQLFLQRRSHRTWQPGCDSLTPLDIRMTKQGVTVLSYVQQDLTSSHRLTWSQGIFFV